MGIKQMGPDLFIMLNDQVGILLLKLLVDDFREIGFFSRAVSIAAIMIMLSQAVMPVLFSSWAGLPEQALCNHVEKVLRFITSFSLTMALGLIFFGKWAVLLLYGNEFLPAVNPMRVIAAGASFAIVNRTLIQLFSGRGMPGKCTLVLASGSVITAILCMLFVPIWGSMGCASAITIGQFIVLLILFINGSSHFHFELRHCALINRNDLRHTVENILRFKAGI